MKKVCVRVIKIALLILCFCALLLIVQCYHAFTPDGRVVRILEDANQKIEGDVYHAFSDTYEPADRMFISRDSYPNLSVTREAVTVKLENGDVHVLTIEQLAEMDELAGKLLKLTNNKTNIFTPMIKIGFYKATYDAYGLFTIVYLEDSRQWSYLVYYRYYPENDTVRLWGSRVISEPEISTRENYDVPLVPYEDPYKKDVDR